MQISVSKDRECMFPKPASLSLLMAGRLQLVASRLLDAAATWLVRSFITLAMALTLVRGNALAAVPSPTLLVQPPCVSVQSERPMAIDDLSVAVRMHRGGRSLDVWMITPLSVHWHTMTASALPLARQLDALNWPPPGSQQGEVSRFERLVAIPARPWRVPVHQARAFWKAARR